MKRFCGMNGAKHTETSTVRGIATSIIIFTAVLALFLFTLGKTGEQTLIEQKRCLEDAIERGMLQCYVTEGRYPENFAYLEENYGILYDDSQFRVDYRTYGSNLRPDVEILELEGTD